MLLADLRLSEMPTSALLVLKSAILQELHERRKRYFVEKRIDQHQRMQALPQPRLQTFADTEDGICKAIPLEARTQEQGFSLRYLSTLLSQNWYHLFPNTDDTEKRFYVYAHIDPRKPTLKLSPLGIQLPGTPFYIGKGTDQRAYDLKRNDGHRKILSAIRADGYPDDIIVHILKKRLTEKRALALEAKLIYFFGSVYEHADRTGCLINLADHIRPEFLGILSKQDCTPSQPKRPPSSEAVD